MRPDSADLRDMLTDAAVSSLAERGLIELNVSVLARWIGVTPQAVTQRPGGPAGARARVFHLVARTFGDRWLAWVTPPLIADPPVIRVPETAAERHGVAVWAAFGELARGEQAAARVTGTSPRSWRTLPPWNGPRSGVSSNALPALGSMAASSRSCMR